MRRNYFGWVGPIKTKGNGTSRFGAEIFGWASFRFCLLSFKPGGAVCLVFYRSRRLRTVLFFFDRAPKRFETRRNYFGWVGPIKMKGNGTPGFGAAIFSVRPVLFFDF